MMQSLADLQKQFQYYLLGLPSTIEKSFGATVPDLQSRLHIYQHAYRARLHSALSVSYPIIKKYLAKEAFDNICNEYITAYPSQERSIRWFGSCFPTFLTHNYPFLSELARFEWTMGLCFDAEDKALITTKNLASLSSQQWMNLQFQMHPALFILTFSWNCVSIWEALIDDQSLPTVEQYDSPRHWMIWRTAYLTQYVALAADEAWALEAAQQKSFSEICAGLGRWYDEQEIGPVAAQFLKKWLEQGLVCHFTTS